MLYCNYLLTCFSHDVFHKLSDEIVLHIFSKYHNCFDSTFGIMMK